MDKLNKVIPEKMTSFKEERKAKIYPTFNLDSEDLPEIKNWKVNGKYYLLMEVEQMAMRQGKEWQGEGDKKDDRVHATFKILKVGVKEEGFEKEYARRRSGASR